MNILKQENNSLKQDILDQALLLKTQQELIKRQKEHLGVLKAASIIRNLIVKFKKTKLRHWHKQASYLQKKRDEGMMR